MVVVALQEQCSALFNPVLPQGKTPTLAVKMIDAAQSDTQRV